jgi:hypothetical protein
MAASATLKCLGKDKNALFVGQWAAPFLLLGIYNKIVKVEGSDKRDSKNENSSVIANDNPLNNPGRQEKDITV